MTDTINQTDTLTTFQKTTVLAYVPVALFCIVLLLITSQHWGIEALLYLSPLWGIYALGQLYRCIKGGPARKMAATKLALLAITISIALFCQFMLFKKYRQIGETLVSRVQTFQQQHGHFPLTREEIATLELKTLRQGSRFAATYSYSQQNINEGQNYPTIMYSDPNWVCYYFYKFESNSWKSYCP